jgi:hypothetical protein
VRDELTRIGMPAGPKFDAVVEQMFAMQLNGKGKTPESAKRSCEALRHQGAAQAQGEQEQG